MYPEYAPLNDGWLLKSKLNQLQAEICQPNDVHIKITFPLATSCAIFQCFFFLLRFGVSMGSSSHIHTNTPECTA